MDIVKAQNIPTLMIGGRVFTDLDNLIILYGMLSGTTNIYTSYRRQNGTSGYTPGTGKKFQVLATRSQCMWSTNAAKLGAYLLYGDNDLGINSNAAAPVNPVYMGGAANASIINIQTNLVYPLQELAVNFEIPAGKFVSSVMGDSAMVQAHIALFGYEVNA